MYYIKTLETCCDSCEKIQPARILVSEELDKIDSCFYKIALFVVR